MYITRFNDEYFTVENNWTTDTNANMIIDSILELYDDFDEYDEEDQEVLDGVFVDYLGDDYDTDIEARLVQLFYSNSEKLGEFYEILDDMGAMDDDHELDEGMFWGLDEALKKKYIVRKGKKLRVKRSTKKDMGYTTRGGKEVKMKASERRKRRLSQKKASRKRRATMKRAIRKRAKSMRKRKALVRN